MGEKRMVCRGVRGATTVDGNEREEILTATRPWLALIIRRNEIDPAPLGGPAPGSVAQGRESRPPKSGIQVRVLALSLVSDRGRYPR